MAARRVDRADELEAAMNECLSSDGPFLLDVAVAQTENCFPMIPAGHGHHQIMADKHSWYRREAAPA